ncbi:hypothetical protein GGTG_13410 [Gaeumannomyces tritici R3-111a-1]|uniref:Uncharacterized protein n=1 Tax=Gaeumannomyces tritici (strain R3-111a-1) TaxID=644352 RepID=J3PIT0_GAET3|nr:hypothetical protein GGTG_13410 [Gaeumannomyces tritici R3-111a-1]EJT69013.1 hypothetical protein GGTG_13410 [Gaeumannomyces tritici R3-111a-1]
MGVFGFRDCQARASLRLKLSGHPGPRILTLPKGVVNGPVVQLACLVSAVSKARLKVGLPLIQALERLGNGGGHAGVSSVRSLFLATLLDLNGAGGSSCRKPHSETVAAVEEDVGRLDT